MIKRVGLNRDSITIFTYFTLIELILSLVFSYFFSTVGVVIVVVITTGLIYLFGAYAKGLGGSFANSQTKESPFHDKSVIALTIVSTLYSSYLGTGAYWFTTILKKEQPGHTLFYIWLGITSLLLLSAQIINRVCFKPGRNRK